MSIASTNTWVTCPQPREQAHIRLFCFPFAGAGASLFKSWADLLPPDIEVCPIQLPGRENRLRDVAFTRFPSLVRALARAMQPYMQTPFAFFGHSMGALIVFELARYLHSVDAPLPCKLYVSGFRAPQYWTTSYPVHTLPDDQFLRVLREMRGTPEEILMDTELMRVLLPTIRADFELCHSYVYTPAEPLPCPIFALGGLVDSAISCADLDAWSEHTSKMFRSAMLPGDHFFLLGAQKLLLQTISYDLLPLPKKVE
jgi:surfactin synthase thioesterase subunit